MYQLSYPCPFIMFFFPLFQSFYTMRTSSEKPFSKINQFSYTLKIYLKTQ